MLTVAVDTSLIINVAWYVAERRVLVCYNQSGVVVLKTALDPNSEWL